jgi:co-chaperonin GroES (HSP10)
MTFLRPILDHIIVEMEKPAEKIGTLYVADSAKVERYAVVVSTGPLARAEGETQPVVFPGDRVVLVPKGGIEFEYENKKLLVITKESIIGVIEDQADGL